MSETAIVLALLAATVLLHLVVPGLVPSGPDGGNWLAMTQDRFMNRDVMAASVTYPPILPLSLAALLVLLEPLSAIVGMALIAKALLIVATYICARPMGRFFGVLATVLVGAAGAQLEAYSWGAYPQLLGTAFGITSVFYSVRFATSGDRRYLWFAGSLAGLTYLTHTLIGGLLVFALPIAVFHGLYLGKALRPSWSRGAWTVAILAGPGALLSAYHILINPREGVRPVLNPQALNWIESVAKTASEAPIPWLLFMIVGLSALAIRQWDARRAVTLATGASWLIVGVFFFTLIGEPRALLPAQFGIVLLSLLSFQRLLGRLKSGQEPGRWGRAAPSLAKLLIVVGIATVSAILVGSIDRYFDTTVWYRVVDHAEIEALDVLKSEAQPGDLVLASHGHHGNQIGWWVQGYAGVPALTAVDPRYLTFPEEREQALFANRFFEEASPESGSIERLKEVGVDFVVVDRRGVDAPWLDTEVAAKLELFWESGNLVVLRVPT
jgi:hypothetical protein